MSKLTFIISDYFFPATLIIYLLSGVVLIKVACLLCSVLVITTSAPLEKQIRTTEEEKYEGIPPIMTATRQLIESELPEKEEKSFPEVDELAESEYPVAAKEDREFREVNAEEFFRRLERELATKMARREGINGKENKEDRDFELKRNDEKREEKELPADMIEQDEVSRKSPKDEDLTTSDESLRRELEEMLAREIEEETNKRELGEEEEEEEEEEEKELMLRPERMFSREVPEKSERILDREIKTALKEEDGHNKHRREPAEEGRKIEPEEKRENHHEENTASNQKREEEEEEEERAARSRELNFRTMHSGEIIPERKELDERFRASEERKWREREAERERERFDYHGNKEREREELRERRREDALENGRLVHEREMEGRKQRETLGSHGARLEERERFRFRARGN